MNEDNIVLPFHVQQALSYSQVLVFMVASFVSGGWKLFMVCFWFV